MILFHSTFGQVEENFQIYREIRRTRKSWDRRSKRVHAPRSRRKVSRCSHLWEHAGTGRQRSSDFYGDDLAETTLCNTCSASSRQPARLLRVTRVYTRAYTFLSLARVKDTRVSRVHCVRIFRNGGTSVARTRFAAPFLLNIAVDAVVRS